MIQQNEFQIWEWGYMSVVRHAEVASTTFSTDLQDIETIDVPKHRILLQCETLHRGACAHRT